MSDVLEPIIRRIDRRPQPRRGKVIVAVNRKSGKPRPESGPIANVLSDFVGGGVLYEITTDEKHWIDNASTDIAVFPTNERSQIAFRMRISARRDRAAHIAEALHDDKLSPGQVLFKTVQTYLGNLLEHSAQHGPESVIERVALNRVAWQAEIERIVEQRLHLDAEIKFDIQRPIIDTDVTVRAEAIQVTPKDAPHAIFPITVTVVLERIQARVTDPLPRSKDERLNLVRDVVIKAFRDKLSLFAYWFRPSELTNELAAAMSAVLARYAYSLKSLAIDPIVPPAAAEEQIVDVVSWTGRLARPIPFHIETKVRMMPTGAGIYHAQNLPSRKEWIKTQVQAALQSAMHGRDFLDLTAEAERDVHNIIHQRLNVQASTIGHEVDTFVASASIPEKIWLEPVTIQIEREIYKTKNDLVPAEFEIGLVVQFRTLARLEQQIQRHTLTRPNDATDGANDAIRDAIKNSARRAAARTMLQIEPGAYFSEYENWKIPDDNQNIDDRKNKRYEPKNYVRDQIVREIKAELKADFHIDNCEINPRRVDSAVAAIVKHIMGLGDITVDVEIEPSNSSGPHQAVPIKVIYNVSSVAPDQWAMVIQRGINALQKDQLTSDLKSWTNEFLRDRPLEELYNLPLRQEKYLTIRNELQTFAEEKIVHHRGVVVGIKSLDAKHHGEHEAGRGENALDTTARKTYLEIVNRRLKALSAKTDEEGRRDYLLARRAAVQDKINTNPRQSSEHIVRLEQDEAELEKVERQLRETNTTILQQPALPRLPDQGKRDTATDQYKDITPENSSGDTGL